MGLSKSRTIHFVGIGGSGMSGIAEILLNLGHKVQGSDITLSEVIYRLEKLGAKVFIGHDGENVGDAEVLVTSSAVQPDNAEVVTAIGKGIPVIPRAEMLSELMRMKEGIAVAGAHGKTTTSTLIATILAEADLDPTVVIGGRVKKFGSGAKLGKGDFLVAEADESDGSFLQLIPSVSVVTNIDAEHLDHYGTEKKLHEAFLEFCNKVPFFGATIANGDDPVLRSFIPKMNKKYITFGFSDENEIYAEGFKQKGLQCSFNVIKGGKKLGKVEINLPGRHNALNALAAIQTALFLEIDFSKIVKALKDFSGIGRRVEIKGERNGVTVMDDYGHHPTEITATITSLKEAYKGVRLVVLFQPHRYTRTRDCLEGFYNSFKGADILLLAPIYAASEKPIKGIDSKLLFDGVVASGQKNVHLLADIDDIQEWLEKKSKKGDLFLTLGAGNVFLQGEKYIEHGSNEEE